MKPVQTFLGYSIVYGVEKSKAERWSGRWAIKDGEMSKIAPMFRTVCEGLDATDWIYLQGILRLLCAAFLLFETLELYCSWPLTFLSRTFTSSFHFTLLRIIVNRITEIRPYAFLSFRVLILKFISITFVLYSLLQRYKPSPKNVFYFCVKLWSLILTLVANLTLHLGLFSSYF